MSCTIQQSNDNNNKMQSTHETPHFAKWTQPKHELTEKKEYI